MQKFSTLPTIFKFSSFILVFVSLFIIHYSLFIQAALAAPQCTKSGSDFHSLRPYPGDICGPEPQSIAYSCGNTLVVKENFSVYPQDATSCTVNTETKTKTCSFNASRSLTVGVDTSKSKLPIAGLTETESGERLTNPPPDDIQKINDYVSWYLNGTNNRAEGEFLNVQNADDAKKLVDNSGPLNKLLPWEVQIENRIATIKAAGDTRHNQVVACVSGIPFLGERIFGVPVPCYNQNIITSVLTKPLKLLDWDSHLPPLPDDPKYKNQDLHIYEKDYLAWRGNFCTPDITIPIINKKVYLCFPDPTNLIRPNYWSNLFPYIPLSSTKDSEGNLALQTPVNESGTDIQVSQVKLNGETVTPLDFAHLQETPELASLLQTTYQPKDLGESTGENITPVDFQTNCSVLEIRSNAGDKLNGKKMESTLSYQTSFNCNFPSVGTPSACLKTTQVAVPIQIKTPNVDNLWTKTVAGTAAIFRRIFPKLGSGGLGDVIDMPTVAQAQYSSSTNNVSPQSAELYIPHLGGISEYFLKGIQTMLRPKGFGETIAFAPATGEGGEINCDKNAPDVSLKNTLNKQDYNSLAVRWAYNGKDTHALECYNDTVRRAQEAGINPAFALIIWLKESDASNPNYNLDFGAASPAPKGYVDQINEFFKRAKNYTVGDVRCNWENIPADMKDNMHVFAWIYRSGKCDPNAQLPDSSKGETTANDYYKNLNGLWNYITSCPFPNSPTDTSCP